MPQPIPFFFVSRATFSFLLLIVIIYIFNKCVLLLVRFIKVRLHIKTINFLIFLVSRFLAGKRITRVNFLIFLVLRFLLYKLIRANYNKKPSIWKKVVTVIKSHNFWIMCYFKAIFYLGVFLPIYGSLGHYAWTVVFLHFLSWILISHILVVLLNLESKKQKIFLYLTCLIFKLIFYFSSLYILAPLCYMLFSWVGTSNPFIHHMNPLNPWSLQSRRWFDHFEQIKASGSMRGLRPNPNSVSDQYFYSRRWHVRAMIIITPGYNNQMSVTIQTPKYLTVEQKADLLVVLSRIAIPENSFIIKNHTYADITRSNHIGMEYVTTYLPEANTQNFPGIFPPNVDFQIGNNIASASTDNQGISWTYKTRN